MDRLTHVENTDYVFRHYGISFHSDIPTKGTDTFSVVQRDNFIKTISDEEYTKIMVTTLLLPTKLISFNDFSTIQQIYSNKELNVFYQIIKDLGCEGPEIQFVSEQ